ncbi:hypothetical protein H696_00684 [Fonticula alba]|uniref:glutaminase n=1 Tax=Fonticula alba TaxID=691883 RepID=A0A058ZGP2_FONAL|nr:hypothetical protein H696_00684 [Fonticula alba]KCV73136.1 hypothetical protein H696_00684 [Fonticula alba]|eukprot:XP_009492837.1 hypothetical protein H696_00684 [Fonticula alba]
MSSPPILQSDLGGFLSGGRPGGVGGFGAGAEDCASVAGSVASSSSTTAEDTYIQNLFATLDPEGTGAISRRTLESITREAGLDPVRLTPLREQLDQLCDPGGDSVDYDTFYDLMTAPEHAGSILRKTIGGQLVIPSFTEFCQELVDIFESVRMMNTGQRASYIPELSRVPSQRFGIAVCTVDGQVFEYGDASDTRGTTCMQATCTPFSYALAFEEAGQEKILNHVGREPSGAAFNAFILNADGLPHNPMINAGAIVTATLIKPGELTSTRMQHVMDRFQKMAGGMPLSFSQPVYLSELETAHRNFALGYFMKSQGAYPSDMNVEEALDFYFQLCSLEVTCEQLAIMTATLANRGVCPLSEEVCFSLEAAKSTIQLMYSCGMNESSGEWACTIGLPAKSGVSGCIILCIPNVLGLAIWSPNIDECGNSVRGTKFSRELCDRFSLNIFDQLIGTTSHIDPTLPINYAEGGPSAPNASLGRSGRHGLHGAGVGGIQGGSFIGPSFGGGGGSGGGGSAALLSPGRESGPDMGTAPAMSAGRVSTGPGLSGVTSTAHDPSLFTPTRMSEAPLSLKKLHSREAAGPRVAQLINKQQHQELQHKRHQLVYRNQ